MSARFSLRSILVGALFTLGPATLVHAQDVVQTPQVENSKYHFEGAINSASVYVRSGPGEGYYATQMLSKGANVVVVGIKFDWLKIEPPDGSFSYVGKAFVDLQADGKVGRVNRKDVNVRSGSDLNALKTTVQTHLSEGDTVEVLGQEDEYLKIKPPAGAYLYINKQFVDPVRALADNPPADSQNGSPQMSTPAGGQQVAASTQPENAVAFTSTPTAKVAAAPTIDAPAAQPSTIPSSAVASGVSSTRPSGPQVAAATQPSPEELFAKYESAFDEISKQPIADQDLDALTASYKSIENNDQLSDELKRMVELRIATLDARSESKAKILEIRKMEQDAKDKLHLEQIEQQELEAQLQDKQIQIYTAVGTLQPSSLQVGGATLYRLVDPGTGRTVIYIRTSDEKAASLMGQFVGVHGTPNNDSQLPLRVIAPTDMQTVDPAKVNGSIAAEILPPSMLARQASASAGPTN